MWILVYFAVKCMQKNGKNWWWEAPFEWEKKSKKNEVKLFHMEEVFAYFSEMKLNLGKCVCKRGRTMYRSQSSIFPFTFHIRRRNLMHTLSKNERNAITWTMNNEQWSNEAWKIVTHFTIQQRWINNFMDETSYVDLAGCWMKTDGNWWKLMETDRGKTF